MGAKQKQSFVMGIATVLVVVVLCAFILQSGVLAGILYPKGIMVYQLANSPQLYVDKKVKVSGFMLKNIGTFWGETYDLIDYLYESPRYAPREMQTSGTFKVALAGKAEMLEPLVHFTFDGRDYKRLLGTPDERVVIEGIFRDQGQVVDAPRYYIEVNKAYSHMQF